MVLASTRAELLRMRLTLAHSTCMSFLQPLRVVLGLSGMVIVLRHVVVFLESTFAITTLTKRHFTWHQASRLLFGNSQPCLTLYLRMAVGLPVESLHDLKATIDNLSDTDYQDLVENTKRVGKGIRDGHYLLTALNNLK